MCLDRLQVCACATFNFVPILTIYPEHHQSISPSTISPTPPFSIEHTLATYPILMGNLELSEEEKLSLNDHGDQRVDLLESIGLEPRFVPSAIVQAKDFEQNEEVQKQTRMNTQQKVRVCSY